MTALARKWAEKLVTVRPCGQIGRDAQTIHLGEEMVGTAINPHWAEDVAGRLRLEITATIAAAVHEALAGYHTYPLGGLDGLLSELVDNLRTHGAVCANPETCGSLGCLVAKIYHQRKAIAALREGRDD